MVKLIECSANMIKLIDSAEISLVGKAHHSPSTNSKVLYQSDALN